MSYTSKSGGVAASATDMKKILTMAMFDDKFRGKLVDSPQNAAEELGVKIDSNQEALLTDVVSKLRALDSSQMDRMKISVEQELDLVTGDPIGPVAGHASTGVSW